MKGLMIKDAYTLVKQMKVFLIMLVVFACIPGYSVSSFAVIYASMLPMTSIAYDERSRWDRLAAMMPYSARDIIMSKYVLGYILTGIAALLSLAAQAVASVFSSSAFGTEYVISILLVLCCAVIIQSAELPIIFRFGVEKGRLSLIILTVVIVIVIMSFGGGLVRHFAHMGMNVSFMTAACITAALVINVISVFISQKAYAKKMQAGH